MARLRACTANWACGTYVKIGYARWTVHSHLVDKSEKSVCNVVEPTTVDNYTKYEINPTNLWEEIHFQENTKLATREPPGGQI